MKILIGEKKIVFYNDIVVYFIFELDLKKNKIFIARFFCCIQEFCHISKKK